MLSNTLPSPAERDRSCHNCPLQVEWYKDALCRFCLAQEATRTGPGRASRLNSLGFRVQDSVRLAQFPGCRGGPRASMLVRPWCSTARCESSPAVVVAVAVW